MDWMKTLAHPASSYNATATNSSCAATFTKSPQATAGVFITKIVISASAAPASTQEATLTGPVNAAGSAVTIKVELPAAAFAPIVIDYGTHPLRCAANTDAVLTVPALGSGVICSATIHGYYGPTS